MTQRLTAARFHQVQRELKKQRAKITKPCPDCGGKPFRADEDTRICPLCRNIWIKREPAPDPLHDLITEALRE